MKNKIYVNARYGFREDTLENWQRANPILEKGEPSIVRNPTEPSEWLKIGDGETAWNDLPYKKGPQGQKGDKGEKGPQGAQGPQGEKGEDGVDGKDYILTDTDKTDIANRVINILPTWQGGSY